MKYSHFLYLSLFLASFLFNTHSRASSINTTEERENLCQNGYTPPHDGKLSQEILEPSTKVSGSSVSAAPLELTEKRFLHLRKLQLNIENAYKHARPAWLFQMYDAFEKAQYDEATWDVLAQKFKARKWPLQQTWKQALGGHLFFPEERIYDYIHSDNLHLLERIDMLWGCALAATFHHPLALFHLGDKLIALHWTEQEFGGDKEAKVILFARSLLERAYQDLVPCLNEANVLYTVYRGHFLDAFNHSRYLPSQKLDLSLENKDLKGQFIILRLKEQMRRLYTPPTLEAYLSLARQGFLPAYQKACQLAQAQKQNDLEISLLREAASKKYEPAYIRLAEIENQSSSTSEEWLQKGMEMNIPDSFILKGLSLVGDISQDKIKVDKVEKLPPSVLKEASSFFEKAGKLHDPIGFEYLGKLKLKLSKLSLNKELRKSLQTEAARAFKEGCKLGSATCYGKILKISEALYDQICQEVGPDPDTELWRSFKYFLENKGGFKFKY